MSGERAGNADECPRCGAVLENGWLCPNCGNVGDDPRLPGTLRDGYRPLGASPLFPPLEDYIEFKRFTDGEILRSINSAPWSSLPAGVLEMQKPQRGDVKQLGGGSFEVTYRFKLLATEDTEAIEP
jgi:hypothetical protein